MGGRESPAEPDKLHQAPELQGKALRGDLAGYRAVRAADQRFRVLYRLESELVIVIVIALGLRKDGSKRDIYALARKLLRLRLRDPASDR